MNSNFEKLFTVRLDLMKIQFRGITSLNLQFLNAQFTKVLPVKLTLLKSTSKKVSVPNIEHYIDSSKIISFKKV